MLGGIDQRPRAYRLGERLVLDQLKQLVLEDDGTGRDREIAADLESLLVGHRDAAFAEILEQVPHARRHAVAAGLHRTLDRLGIGGKVVRRAQRIQDLPCEETHSCPRPVVEGRTLDQIVHVAGVHEVRLLEKLVRAFLPLACEPPIALGRLHRAGTDDAVHPQRAHLLQVVLLDQGELAVAREVRCVVAARQQAGRKLLHHRLAGLRKARQVLERDRVVHWPLNAASHAARCAA